MSRQERPAALEVTFVMRKAGEPDRLETCPRMVAELTDYGWSIAERLRTTRELMPCRYGRCMGVH